MALSRKGDVEGVVKLFDDPEQNFSGDGLKNRFIIKAHCHKKQVREALKIFRESFHTSFNDDLSMSSSELPIAPFGLYYELMTAVSGTKDRETLMALYNAGCQD